jgi:hypothetical protein
MLERLKAACLMTLGLYLVYFCQNFPSDFPSLAFSVSQRLFPQPQESWVTPAPVSLAPERERPFSSVPLAY